MPNNNPVIGGFAGSNLPIYGWGASSAPIPPSGSPILIIQGSLTASGLISGGDVFTILNSGLSNAAFEDTFTSGSLNLAKWTDISSGGGSVSTGAGLNMSISTAGGTAGIRTVASYKNFDVSVRFTYDNTIEQLFPSSDITFLRLTARIDATNNFTIATIWDPTRGPSLRTTITIDGVTSTVLSNNVKSANKTLRLVRFGGRIQSYVGNSLLADFKGWRGDDVNIEVVSSSTSVPIPLQTVVSKYIPAILVTFGDDIGPASFVVVDRVVGTTPSTILPLAVEVQAHNVNNTITLGPASFQYITPLQLTVSNNNDSLVVSNDNTLRDSTSALRGFRL